MAKLRDQSQILTINAGSSSIKFALFEMGASLQRVFEGKIDRIGLSGTTLEVKGLAENVSQTITPSNYSTAIHALIEWLDKHCQHQLTAIGHRVVHGGPKYWRPERITSEMLKELQQFASLDPEHIPQEIQLIEAFQHEFPKLCQIACFDTAFHHDLPCVAKLLPIPRRLEALGIRRYGFHGLSYEFLLKQIENLDGLKVAKGKIVFAHLGNGSSLAATAYGKAIDTSMGFTPTAGVPMSTRSGDLDPGLVGYLARSQGMDAKQFNEMVNFHSGLLGLSEISSDMQDLIEKETQDERAAEAIALFCYQVKKWIGAFAAALGGIDALVFAGGIGENAPLIRKRICDGLKFLGIELKEKQKEKEGIISSKNSRVLVRVVRTDEEWMIAHTICRLLQTKG